VTSSQGGSGEIRDDKALTPQKEVERRLANVLGCKLISHTGQRSLWRTPNGQPFYVPDGLYTTGTNPPYMTAVQVREIEIAVFQADPSLANAGSKSLFGGSTNVTVTAKRRTKKTY